MPRSISVTASQETQSLAAENVSKLLSALGYRHAFIGGFAWSLLGSRRLTQISLWPICHPMLKSNLFSFGGHDIDILIEKKPGIEFEVLRRQITALDKRFAQAGVQFYFVPDSESNPTLKEEELVYSSKNNVLVETLPTGSLGLPVTIEHIYVIPESTNALPILHPSILILTKLKRLVQNSTSTRPKSMLKAASDKADIHFIICWLADQNMHIWFDKYHGKSRIELLTLVRFYYNMFSDDAELMEQLKGIVQPNDWEEMMGLTV